MMMMMGEDMITNSAKVAMKGKSTKTMMLLCLNTTTTGSRMQASINLVYFRDLGSVGRCQKHGNRKGKRKTKKS
jgi:hypothetical protein